MKVTGEIFSSSKTIQDFAQQLKQARKNNREFVIIIGGGNFFRGRNVAVTDQLITDRAGMLGTVINGILLEHMLKPYAIHLSVLDIKGFVKHYEVTRALQYLAMKKILIVSGGTGLPFFSTDTATALRALELSADAVFKATNVDGIYSKDPRTNKNAQFIEEITYEQALRKGIQVIDQHAFILLKDHKIPIVVFNIFKTGNLQKVIAGQRIGSIVC